MIHPNSRGKGGSSSSALAPISPQDVLLLEIILLHFLVFFFFLSRDTSYALTALQGELEEGHRCSRARESRQVKHPSAAHRLPFL